MPRHGHIYVVRLDKERPALIISIDGRNRFASDVLVVPCSTVLSMSATHVVLRRGDGGVRRASVLKCEQITTIAQEDVLRGPLGGPLPARLLGAVQRAIMRAVGVPVPEPD